MAHAGARRLRSGGGPPPQKAREEITHGRRHRGTGSEVYSRWGLSFEPALIGRSKRLRSAMSTSKRAGGTAPPGAGGLGWAGRVGATETLVTHQKGAAGLNRSFDMHQADRAAPASVNFT